MINLQGQSSRQEPAKVKSDSALIKSATVALVRQLIPSTVVRFLAYLSFWTIVAFASALHWWFYPQGNYPYTWWQLVSGKVAVWYTWGAIAPLVLWLGCQFRVDAGARLKHVLILTALAIVVTLAYLAVYTQWILLVIGAKLVPEAYANMFRFAVSMHSTYFFLAFWALIAIEHIVAYYHRYLERERLTAQLQAQLAVAQLERLKNQLQPHFLFNALNTVSSMVLSDKKSEAYDTLADLAELLRISLDNNQSEFVSLAEELEFSKLYVSVMSRRFPDHIMVDWQIEPAMLDAAVPNMILQPLIENAIKHGAGVETAERCVTIRADNVDGRVRFAVGNPLAGDLAEAPRDGHGIGLTHTKERLQYHYGTECEFAISTENKEFDVTIMIPYKKLQNEKALGTHGQTAATRSNR